MIRSILFFALLSSGFSQEIKTVSFSETNDIFSNPERGDIVVFKHPDGSGINLIKRLIGLPGDRIMIADGLVWVNGRRISAPHISRDELIHNLSETIIPLEYEEKSGEYSYIVRRLPNPMPTGNMEFTVPAQSYFFLGDNHLSAVDDIIIQSPMTADHHVLFRLMPGLRDEIIQHIFPIGEVQKE